MANLFSYIDEIREVGGHEGLLEAGSPVMARTQQGYEPLGNPLEEPTLVGALTSVLTSEQQVDLAVGNIIQFPVERPSGRWHVLIESTATGLRVRMRGPALEIERKKQRRTSSSTPAVFIETPADSGGRLSIPLGVDGGREDGGREDGGANDLSDPFQAADHDEASSSGVHQQPDWEVAAPNEASPSAGSATARGGSGGRETLSDLPDESRAVERAGESQAEPPVLAAGGGLDPFSIEDDLDDEFEIEDPFADFGGASAGLEAAPHDPAEEEDDGFDDARSPFDFDDEELEGGGMQANSEAPMDAERADVEASTTSEPEVRAGAALGVEEADEATMDESLDDEDYQPDLGGEDAEGSSSPEGEDDQPDFGGEDAEGSSSPEGEDDHVDLRGEDAEDSPSLEDELVAGMNGGVTHESGPYEAMTAGFGASWSIIAEGADAAALVDPIPAGALCHLLGDFSFEASGLDILAFTETDDEAAFLADSRLHVSGRILSLDVEDPSRWLTWVGRRLEAGSRVLVRSDATTAEGAWRGFVGLQSRNRAEAWFAEHPHYAICVTDDGYLIARRSVK